MFVILPVITEWTTYIKPMNSHYKVNIVTLTVPHSLTRLSHLTCKILEKMSSTQKRNRRGSGKNIFKLCMDLF